MHLVIKPWCIAHEESFQKLLINANLEASLFPLWQNETAAAPPGRNKTMQALFVFCTKDHKERLNNSSR